MSARETEYRVLSETEAKNHDFVISRHIYCNGWLTSVA
jgi:hypothetical protein